MMWVAIIWMTSRLVHGDAWVERGAALGLMGVWTHLTIHSLVDKLYVSNIFLHIGVMLGVLAVLQVRAREKEARGRSWSKRTHRAQAM
jgi:hypothetical protein